MDLLRVTLDTNAFDAPKLARIKAVIGDLPIELVRVTVTDRELEDATRTQPSEGLIRETAVWGESRFGFAVWGGAETTSLLESILSTISGGGFPKRGKRENLSKGHLHMLRDAMILAAHARDGRNALVSIDTKAYGHPGSELRQRLEDLCGTKIMTIDEFCAACERLRNGEKV